MREPTVSSVMTTKVITVGPETSFKDVVETLSGNGISAVPVVGPQGKVVGVVSEADVLPKQEFHGGADPQPRGLPRRRVRWYRSLGLCAAEVMTSPVVTIGPDDSVTLAARRLAEKKVRRLFVVDTDDHLVGVVSRRDVLGTFLRPDSEIRTDIQETLNVTFGAEAERMTTRVTDGVAIVDGGLERRSQTALVVRLIRSVPGVVGVRSNLGYRIDDMVETGAWTGFGP